jgi:hypothetical protein
MGGSRSASDLIRDGQGDPWLDVLAAADRHWTSNLVSSLFHPAAFGAFAR